MSSVTSGSDSSSSGWESQSWATCDSSSPSLIDSPSSKLRLAEALSDEAISSHLHLFSAPSTGNLLQTRLSNTREWIAHNLDPPISERADVVPLQSLTADISNTLSLHYSLDCPYVSENAMILAAACLDPDLEWAWTKLGLNFEQKED
eukprot:3012759-Rhodomonas_salina.3